MTSPARKRKVHARLSNGSPSKPAHAKRTQTSILLTRAGEAAANSGAGLKDCTHEWAFIASVEVVNPYKVLRCMHCRAVKHRDVKEI